MTTHSYSAVIDSPIGKLGIKTTADTVFRIDFLKNSFAICSANSSLCKKVVKQLNAYFADPSYRFDLPLAAQGTVFQQSVWQALTEIPKGSVLTYGSMAKLLQSGARAVGNACRRNPLPILVPCHRVVAAQNLGGFAGATQGKMLTTKRWLLQHEKYL